MAEPPALLRVTALPFATIVGVAGPVVPRRRYLAAYRVHGEPLPVLGQAVIDEFRTISAPICLVPRNLAGKIYDRGLALSFARDPDMGIDSGWPPLVVGLPIATPALPADWTTAFDDAYGGAEADTGAPLLPVERWSVAADGFVVTVVRQPGATVLATDAPMLPRQLGRLAESQSVASAPGGVVIAVGLGNFLQSRDQGPPQDVPFLAESAVAKILSAVATRGAPPRCGFG